MKHTGQEDVKPGDLVTVKPDFVAVHDIYTENLLKKFTEMGFDRVWDPEKIAVIQTICIRLAWRPISGA